MAMDVNKTAARLFEKADGFMFNNDYKGLGKGLANEFMAAKPAEALALLDASLSQHSKSDGSVSHFSNDAGARKEVATAFVNALIQEAQGGNKVAQAALQTLAKSKEAMTTLGDDLKGQVWDNAPDRAGVEGRVNDPVRAQEGSAVEKAAKAAAEALSKLAASGAPSVSAGPSTVMGNTVKAAAGSLGAKLNQALDTAAKQAKANTEFEANQTEFEENMKKAGR